MAFVISGNSGEQGHPLDHLCMLALESMQSWEWNDIPHQCASTLRVFTRLVLHIGPCYFLVACVQRNEVHLCGCAEETRGGLWNQSPFGVLATWKAS